MRWIRRILIVALAVASLVALGVVAAKEAPVWLAVLGGAGTATSLLLGVFSENGNRVEDLSSLIATKDTRITELEQSLETLNNRISVLRVSLESLQKVNQANTVLIANLRRQINHLELEVKKKNKEVLKLTREKATLEQKTEMADVADNTPSDVMQPHIFENSAFSKI